MKGEVGQISKEILENVNKQIRKTTKLNQWISHTDTIQWFKKIENKKNKKFIQVDVVNFYPFISENLLKNAIEWARQYIEISQVDEETILNSKQSILFNEEAQ